MMRADPWSPLGRSLVFGAAYDAVFGVAILALLRPSAALLGIDVPENPFYLRLTGVLLCMLAGVYFVASRAPRQHHAVVWVAIVGRACGFALFLAESLRAGPPVFGALAIGDLGFAIAHGALLFRARRLQGSSFRDAGEA